MTPEAGNFLAAFTVGLLGSSHCLGMCGGIVGALSLALPPAERRGWRLFRYTLAYNLGRIASYSLAGALVGGLGWGLDNASVFELGIALRLVGALFLILMGLYLAGIWPVLAHLEKLGRGFWAPLSRFGKRFIPMDRLWKALLAGILWGWLPCGLTYSALGWSLAAGSPLAGAELMLGFGLGTLPAMLALGGFSERLRRLAQSRTTRLLAGLLLTGFGLWTAYQLFTMSGHHA